MPRVRVRHAPSSYSPSGAGRDSPLTTAAVRGTVRAVLLHYSCINSGTTAVTTDRVRVQRPVCSHLDLRPWTFGGGARSSEDARRTVGRAVCVCDATAVHSVSATGRWRGRCTRFHDASRPGRSGSAKRRHGRVPTATFLNKTAKPAPSGRRHRGAPRRWVSQLQSVTTHESQSFGSSSRCSS